MRKFLLFFSLLLIICFNCTDSYPDQYWAKIYDFGDDSVTSVQPTFDGGYIVGGTSQFDRTYRNIVVFKVDGGGNIVWQKNYGEGILSSLHPTFDGGYILAGDIVDVNTIGYKKVVFKLDSTGNVLWQKAYVGYSLSGISSIQQASDGGYIVEGWDTDGKGTFDMLFLKLDSSGHVLWGQRKNDSSIYSMEQTSDGGFIATTQSEGVLKFDSSGNVEWHKTYRDSISYGGSLRYIKQTADGGYVLAGKEQMSEDYSWRLRILKLNSSGTIIWQRLYISDVYESPRSIQQTADGGYIVLSIKDCTINCDFLLLKLDSTGNISWQKTYVGSSNHSGAFVLQDISGNYIVAVTNYSCDKDFLILKLDNDGDIPYCNLMDSTHVITTDASAIARDLDIYFYSSSVSESESNSIPQDINIKTLTLCSGTSVDVDNDGIADGEDNCPVDYNPLQEDTFPPGGNRIGDVCDCEGNFDCDNDVDGTDAATFKEDFGRISCSVNCHGDFDCDQDVDGTDAVKFKEDFGRSSLKNICPAYRLDHLCFGYF